MFCGFSSLCAPLTETGYIWGFWTFSGEAVRVNVEEGSGGIFTTLCVEFCLVTSLMMTQYSIMHIPVMMHIYIYMTNSQKVGPVGFLPQKTCYNYLRN